MTLKIVGTVSEFPTLDPAKPFAIVDGPTLALERYAATGSTADPGEWWLSSSDPDAVAPAVAAGPNPDATVISRVALERSFAGDPSGLGVIGLLGLGSVAAMVFAAIGFLVSAAISTSERAGELALLRALGLSRGQISSWLSIEHAALLVVGIGTGVGIGALLAWLVLPFSTLTRTGEPAQPAPVVVVPIEGLIPIGGVALVILLLTTLALRSQLGRVQVGNVLRARGRVMTWIGLSLRRLNDERSTALAFAALVFVTALLAAVTPRALDRIASDALRQQLLAAPPAPRSIQLLQEGRPGAGDDDPMGTIATTGAHLFAVIPPEIRALIAEQGVVIDSPRWSVQDPTNHSLTLRLRIQPGAETHFHLTAGRMPQAAATIAPAGPIEIAIATSSAKALGASLGDAVPIEIDGTDPLAGPRGGGSASATIVGLFDVEDPTGPVVARRRGPGGADHAGRVVERVVHRHRRPRRAERVSRDPRCHGRPHRRAGRTDLDVPIAGPGHVP